MGLGFLSLGMAYVGVVVPGIPFSIFLVFAAYCFAKSSKRMHNWLYNHKYFGPFLTNWVQKKVFPTKGKYLMILVMASSLAFLWFTTENIKTKLSQANTALIGLLDRIRMLDNDLIRLRSKLNTVLEMQENEKNKNNRSRSSKRVSKKSLN